MNKRLLIATLVLAGFTNAANAALVNASDYFNSLITSNNTVQQSTNTWQLGFLNGSAFTLFSYNNSGFVVGSGDQSKFDSYASNTYVGFGVNVSNSGANYFGNTIAKNELYAHPGDGSPDLVLRYYASTNGFFNFDTTVRNAHTGTVEVAVIETVGSASTEFSRTLISNGSTNYMRGLNLNIGDTIDFVINDFNGWGADGSAINANAGIAQVPEPSTLAVLAVALLGFARFRRKA